MIILSSGEHRDILKLTKDDKIFTIDPFFNPEESTVEKIEKVVVNAINLRMVEIEESCYLLPINQMLYEQDSGFIRVDQIYTGMSLAVCKEFSNIEFFQCKISKPSKKLLNLLEDNGTIDKRSCMTFYRLVCSPYKPYFHNGLLTRPEN